MSNLTLGSLFDGSGGFPLGGLISGITPLWASEIEPFPIRGNKQTAAFYETLRGYLVYGWYKDRTRRYYNFWLTLY